MRKTNESIMSLPSEGIIWKEYEIDTPTFKLTPIEKPDLSPYLIHMTGRNSLLSILKGEVDENGKPVHPGIGVIQSRIPQFDSAVQYDSSVVCFTETPLFAIDFFRYRSYRRWRGDQRYGIGFDKSYLVQTSTVRPVLYTDSGLTNQILRIVNRIANGQMVIEGAYDQYLVSQVFNQLKPLIFPLLEAEAKQGYMWEREWRYPFDNHFRFNYDSIKIICCPNDERPSIQDILGDRINQIQIVETWKEYDEVTSYLKRREIEVGKDIDKSIEQIGNVEVLQELKTKNDQTSHALNAYYSVFKDTLTALDSNGVEGLIGKLNATSSKIDERIKLLKEKEKQKDQKPKT